MGALGGKPVLCGVHNQQVSLSDPVGVSGCCWDEKASEGGDSVPASLQSVPFKSAMSSEAGEMSSKCFWQN